MWLWMKKKTKTDMFCSNGTDETTFVILQLLTTAFGTYSKKLLFDHLLGGKFHNMSAEQQRTTESVQITNVVSERTFALLDRLRHQKPDTSAIAIQGIVLFCSNHTGEWLRNQSEHRPGKLFKSTLAGSQEHRHLYRQRSQAMCDFQRQKMMEKETQRLQKEAHTLQDKEQLLEKIMSEGLWNISALVQRSSPFLPTVARKVSALKSQIKFGLDWIGL
eukprot:scpid58079/ scgid31016/ 